MKKIREKIRKVLGVLLVSGLSLNLCFAGNESSGGGNGAQRELADRKYIESTIAVSKYVLKFVLNSVYEDFLNENGDADYIAWRKVFNGHQNPFKKLSEIEIKVQAAACSHEGKASDGAAYGGNKICLSLDRLLKRKYSLRDTMPNIVGLVAHEYSHLLGASESEAHEIQAMVVSITQSIDRQYVLFAIQALEENLYKIAANWDLFFQNAGQQNNLVQFCSTASLLLSDISEFKSLVQKISEQIVDGYSGVISFRLKNELINSQILISNVVANGCGLSFASNKSGMSQTSYGRALQSANERMTMPDVLAEVLSLVTAEMNDSVPPSWDISELGEDKCEGNPNSDCLGRKSFIYNRINLNDRANMAVQMKASYLSYMKVDSDIKESVSQADTLIDNIQKIYDHK